ncbi:hypothetical protein HUX88_28985 [Duganella sp. BJB1802]|uniref:hypothetical protein n=1 Tax=Duganella sp. BJB1802 TaxID=2744575 RepID=UPI00159414DF|nr:hypothetical protein [Duganella sp. BJB1802]NVD74524.1 hypothetical protein [Duganella sp. BJB1802]
MSAPTKIKAGAASSRSSRATKAQPTKAAPLTAGQKTIATLYGMMDDRRQGEMLRYAAGIAEAFPRRHRRRAS